MGTVTCDFVFPKQVQMTDILFAMVQIRENSVQPDLKCQVLEQNEKKWTYNLTHKIPIFMAIFFPNKCLELKEEIFINHLNQSPPELLSVICSENSPQNLSLITVTKYSEIGLSDSKEKYVDPHQILARTTVTLKAPFNIPKIIEPLIKNWHKEKTNSIRKLELNFALQKNGKSKE